MSITVDGVTACGIFFIAAWTLCHIQCTIRIQIWSISLVFSWFQPHLFGITCVLRQELCPPQLASASASLFIITFISFTSESTINQSFRKPNAIQWKCHNHIHASVAFVQDSSWWMEHYFFYPLQHSREPPSTFTKSMAVSFTPVVGEKNAERLKKSSSL